MKDMHRAAAPALFCFALTACGSVPPLPTVGYVDLPRFMGDWYVIASIPTFLERGAHNAVESYELAADGTIETTFTFRKGAFDGPLKTFRPRGFVRSASNAVWGMQFIWPIEADYRVIYLDDAYETTVIGREKRDFVWVMARTPEISRQRYQEVLDLLTAVGYDIDELERVPQRW